MSGSLKSMVSVAALVSLLVFAGSPNAGADQRDTEDRRGIKNFLTEHTLVYADKLGEENLIHFGRFGNFDWYFPCQFESGSWNLGPDLVLRLTYDSPRFTPRQYRLARRDEGIILTEPDSGGTTVAKLLEGNRLPFG